MSAASNGEAELEEVTLTIALDEKRATFATTFADIVVLRGRKEVK